MLSQHLLLLLLLQQPQLAVKRPALHWRWELSLAGEHLVEARVVLIIADV
jgi:hypothetical protein